jgi:hypothetical protein
VALKYTVTLPEQPAKDLGQRELRLTVGDQPEVVKVLDAKAVEAEFLVERGQTVAVHLVDVDTSGNKSLPGPVLTFVAEDTIPPSQPGALVVKGVVEAD